MKITKRNSARYPYKIEVDGKKVLIPQQKQFGLFCRKHGCSVTACSVALQWLGVRQEDGTIWSPKEVYQMAKQNVGGYNGSKLSIWGSKNAINRIAGHIVAYWHPNDGKHNAQIRATIDRKLRQGCVVLFEERAPVHTVIFLGVDSKGRWITATNGKIVRRSPVLEVRKGLHGSVKPSDQKNWWNGKEHGAGYVIVG